MSEEQDQENEDISVPHPVEEAFGESGEATQLGQEVQQNSNDGVLIAEQLISFAQNITTPKKIAKEEETESED